MNILGIRIFGVVLIIFAINMLMAGTWANIDHRLAQKTYKMSKSVLANINDTYNTYGLKDPLDEHNFRIDYEELSNGIIEYSQRYVFQQRLSAYLFSALSIIIGVFYFIAGVGTLRFRRWARTYGFIAAGLWPFFYAHIIMSAILHLGFLNDTIIAAQSVAAYLNAPGNPYSTMLVMDSALPKITIISVLTCILFCVMPVFLFLIPAVSEELD